jgi:hypothetical protein
MERTPCKVKLLYSRQVYQIFAALSSTKKRGFALLFNSSRRKTPRIYKIRKSAPKILWVNRFRGTKYSAKKFFYGGKWGGKVFAQ